MGRERVLSPEEVAQNPDAVGDEAVRMLREQGVLDDHFVLEPMDLRELLARDFPAIEFLVEPHIPEGAASGGSARPRAPSPCGPCREPARRRDAVVRSCS